MYGPLYWFLTFKFLQNGGFAYSGETAPKEMVKK